MMSRIMNSIRNAFVLVGCLTFVMTVGQTSAITYTNDACVYYPVEAYGGTQSDTVPDASGNGQDGIADVSRPHPSMNISMRGIWVGEE